MNIKKYIIENYFNIILLEDKIKDLKEKYKNIFPEDVIEKIINIDFTPQKKYLPWIFKTLANERSNLDQNILQLAGDGSENNPGLIKIFDKLINLNKLQGQDRDIYQYKTVEQLYDKIKHYVDLDNLSQSLKSKSEQEEEIKVEGAKTIFENDYIKIVWLLDRDASVCYGKGTKWCISATSPQYSHYFDDYTYGKKVNIYVFLFKNKALEEFPEIEKNDLNKVAYVVKSANLKDNTIWDVKDNEFIKNKKFEIFTNILNKINPKIVQAMLTPVEQKETIIKPKSNLKYIPRPDLEN